MDATCSINTLHNLALGRGERGKQIFYSGFAQRNFSRAHSGLSALSFVFPNRPDRVQHPFSWPTGYERNRHGWRVGAWEELGLWQVFDAVTGCLSALGSSHLSTCLHTLRALKCY